VARTGLTPGINIEQIIATKDNIMDNNKFIYLPIGLLSFIAGWLLQLLILNIGVYLFGFLFYNRVPSIVVIQSARYLSRHVTRKTIYLQWLQPSVALTFIVYLAGSNTNATPIQMILLAFSGYIPLFFFRRNKSMLKKEGSQFVPPTL
jgi:hypothetical protein